MCLSLNLKKLLSILRTPTQTLPFDNQRFINHKEKYSYASVTTVGRSIFSLFSFLLYSRIELNGFLFKDSKFSSKIFISTLEIIFVALYAIVFDFVTGGDRAWLLTSK